MRIFLAIVLWIVGTAAGLLGAGFLSLAGLAWTDGFTTRGYWEEGESGFSVALGVGCFIVWLVLLGVGTVIFREGFPERSSRARTAAIVVNVVLIALVVGVCLLALLWPEPPSEFPTPEWGRA